MKKLREYFAFNNNEYMKNSQIISAILFLISLIIAFVSLEIGGRTNFMISDYALITCFLCVFFIGVLQVFRDNLK